MKSEDTIRKEKKNIEAIVKNNPDICNIGEAVAQVEILKWVLEI